MSPRSKTGVSGLSPGLNLLAYFLFICKCSHNSPNLKSSTSGVEWQLCSIFKNQQKVTGQEIAAKIIKTRQSLMCYL